MHLYCSHCSPKNTIVNPVIMFCRRFNPSRLSKQVYLVVSKIPKEVLVICMCQGKWPGVYNRWIGHTSAKAIPVEGTMIQNSFSQPNLDYENNVRFHSTDGLSSGLLTNKDLYNQHISTQIAWEKAA